MVNGAIRSEFRLIAENGSTGWRVHVVGGY